VAGAGRTAARAARAGRDLTGAVDQAAVLHARIANRPAYAQAAARHTAADVQITGERMLHLLGISAPAPTVLGERADFARDLGAAIVARIEQATTEATAARWAQRLYGPAPADPGALAVYRARVQSAAVYRDITDRTGQDDPLGPAPEAGQYGLRVLWRRAQPDHDVAELRGRALVDADANARWIRGLGPAPEDERAYAAWSTAAAAVLEYRERWDVGHEDQLLGPETPDRVQGADRAAALRLVERYRAAAAGAPPALLPAGPEEAFTRDLDRVRGQLYHARREAARTRQAETDLRNRHPEDPAAAADVARALADARRAAAIAYRRFVTLREQVEAATGQAAASTAQDPAAAQPEREQFGPVTAWRQRPGGRFTDERLAEIEHATVLSMARRAQIDKARADAEGDRGPAVTALQAGRDAVQERGRLAAEARVVYDRWTTAHQDAKRYEKSVEYTTRRLAEVTKEGGWGSRGKRRDLQAELDKATANQTKADTTEAEEKVLHDANVEQLGPRYVDGRDAWAQLELLARGQRNNFDYHLNQARAEDRNSAHLVALPSILRPGTTEDQDHSTLDVVRAEIALREGMDPVQRQAEDQERAEHARANPPRPAQPRNPAPARRPGTGPYPYQQPGRGTNPRNPGLGR